jgi:hypothetical protein
VNDISRTSIVLSAFTLLDVLCAIMIATLISLSYGSDAASGYWVTGIFSIIFLYINIFVHSLNSPFDSPPGMHFDTYVNGAPISPPFLAALSGINGISTESLFSDFGSELRELLYATSNDVASHIYEKHA